MPQLQNPKHELFAQERAKGCTIDEAYVLAGYKPNRGNAARLNANEGVQGRIRELQARGAEKAEISVASVLEQLWAIATADPRELIEHRIGCCRYCWGVGHRYQETQNERDRRHAGWLTAEKERLEEDEEAEHRPFDELGGTGFNATRAPNPACPECFGEGVGRPVLKDTAKISPAAARLYAGVKVTNSGFEVKLHDKVGALTKVGQQLGMFVERRINTNVSVEDFLEQLDASAPGDPGEAPSAEE